MKTNILLTEKKYENLIGAEIFLNIQKVENEDTLVAIKDNLVIGYVANKAQHLLKDSISNEELINMHIQHFTCRGVDIKEVINRPTLIVEFLDEKPKTKEFSMKIKGTLRKYPAKKELLSLLKSKFHYDNDLLLKSSDDQVVAYYKDEPIGTLDEDTKDIGYSEVKATVESRGSLKATSAIAEGNTIILKINTSLDDKLCRNEQKNYSIEEIIENVVSANFATKEKCKNVLSFLQEYDIPLKHIKKVFENYIEYPKELMNLIPNPNNFYKDENRNKIKKCVIYANYKKHLRFVGDKGLGKNKLIETLAWIFNRPLLRMSISMEVDKMDLLGSKTANNGNVYFEPGIVTMAMEYGCILNLDEINTCNAGVLSILHSAMDWSGTLNVPGYKSIIAHKNFLTIGSMNVDYNGTVPLNEAFSDRFVPIVFEQNYSIKNLLINHKSDLSESDLLDCDELYKGIRKNIEDCQLPPECMTIRGFLDAIDVSEDLGLRDALQDNVAFKIDSEDERNKILNMISDIWG